MIYFYPLKNPSILKRTKGLSSAVPPCFQVFGPDSLKAITGLPALNLVYFNSVAPGRLQVQLA